MSKKVKYDYNAETGVATVVIWDKGKKFKGVAKLHDEDKDVACSLTGLTIAEARAEIKRFNAHARSTNAKIVALYRQLDHLIGIRDEQLDTAADIEKGLEKYLTDKATFAKRFRKVKARQAAK